MCPLQDAADAARESGGRGCDHEGRSWLEGVCVCVCVSVSVR